MPRAKKTHPILKRAIDKESKSTVVYLEKRQKEPLNFLSPKWQYKGKPHFETKSGGKSSSVIVKFWNSVSKDYELSDISDEGDIIYQYADLNLSGITLIHIWRYRFSEMKGVYGGPQIIQAKLKAEYKRLEDGPIVKEASRNVTGYGLIAGYYFAGPGKNQDSIWPSKGSLTDCQELMTPKPITTPLLE